MDCNADGRQDVFDLGAIFEAYKSSLDFAEEHDRKQDAERVPKQDAKRVFVYEWLEWIRRTYDELYKQIHHHAMECDLDVIDALEKLGSMFDYWCSHLPADERYALIGR